MINNLKNLVLSNILIIFSLVSVLALFYYGVDLILISLGISWIFSTLALTIVHEQKAHRYISPKNKFIDLFFEIFLARIFCAWTLDINGQHKNHHAYFPILQFDVLNYKIINNSIFNYIFSYNLKKSKGDNYFSIKNKKNVEIELQQLNSIFKFVEKYNTLIKIAVHLGLFGILGIQYYIFFVIIPICYTRIVLCNFFTEVFAHKIYSDNSSFSWAFPIIFGFAYHNEHHADPSKLYIGRGYLKYLNPQYYFIKLFYVINVKLA
jgi:fatty-acid desaturase